MPSFRINSASASSLRALTSRQWSASDLRRSVTASARAKFVVAENLELIAIVRGEHRLDEERKRMVAQVGGYVTDAKPALGIGCIAVRRGVCRGAEALRELAVLLEKSRPASCPARN
jgi:hypothetical protein